MFQSIPSQYPESQCKKGAWILHQGLNPCGNTGGRGGHRCPAVDFLREGRCRTVPRLTGAAYPSDKGGLSWPPPSFPFSTSPFPLLQSFLRMGGVPVGRAFGRVMFIMGNTAVLRVAFYFSRLTFYASVWKLGPQPGISDVWYRRNSTWDTASVATATGI